MRLLFCGRLFDGLQLTSFWANHLGGARALIFNPRILPPLCILFLNPDRSSRSADLIGGMTFSGCIFPLRLFADSAKSADLWLPLG